MSSLVVVAGTVCLGGFFVVVAGLLLFVYNASVTDRNIIRPTTESGSLTGACYKIHQTNADIIHLCQSVRFIASPKSQGLVVTVAREQGMGGRVRMEMC